jgi:hypothetical protein
MKNELIKLLRNQPFQAFVVHVSDGDSLNVGHPEQAMITDTDFYVANGDETHRVSLLHITRLTVAEPVL